MKTIAALFLATISIYTQAATLDIHCLEMDFPYISRFNLVTQIEVSDELRTEGTSSFYNEEVTFNITESGFGGETSQDIEINSRGTVKYFAPGVYGKDEVIQVKSTALESEGYYLNLLLNFPGKNTSTIRTDDGKVYKSNCSII